MGNCYVAESRNAQFFNLGDVCSVISDVPRRAEGVNPRVFRSTSRLTPAARHSYFEKLNRPVAERQIRPMTEIENHPTHKPRRPDYAVIALLTDFLFVFVFLHWASRPNQEVRRMLVC